MLNFNESGLNPEILRAVEELGFETPMPVQTKVVPVILNEKCDVIALAQTGTGKTAAFGLPLLQQLNVALKKPQVLILCPTRELCIQIAGDFESFAKYMQNVLIVAVYGGASIDKQISELKRGAQIVVATPGRILDVLHRKSADFKNVQTLVLDEADEMLNMGFQEDLDLILSQTPADKRTLMFSATMSKQVASIASNYMHDPLEIIIGKRNEAATNVKHIYYMVNAHDRYLALKRIIDVFPDLYAIVFCRTRQETKDIAEKLIKDGYNADSLHGDLSQAQRDMAMQKFRLRNLQMLVATDVAARGLDVTDLTHVINYNLPDDTESYTHRSGRTGRAGKTGISVIIIHSREQNKIHEIERLINKKIERKSVPEGKEVCEKQLFNLINKIQSNEVDLTQLEPFLPVIYKQLEWMSKEELIQKLVGFEFSRLLSYYENAPDLNKSVSNVSQREDKRKTRGDNFVRFFINVGAIDGLKPANLIGFINDQTRNKSIEIGRIDIMHKFSFFECEPSMTDSILSSFEGAQFEGRPIVVDLAQGRDNVEKSDRQGSRSSGESRDRSSRRDKSSGNSSRNPNRNRFKNFEREAPKNPEFRHKLKKKEKKTGNSNN